MDRAINLLSSLSIFIPVLIGLVHYYKINKTYKLLFFLLITGGIIEVLIRTFQEASFHRFLLNLYTIAEVIFLAWMYHRLITSNQWKKGIRLVVALLIIFSIVNLLYIQGKKSLNSVSMALECFFFIVLSARLFYQLTVNLPSQSLLNHAQFWFNAGVFVYFSLNVFTFLASNDIYANIHGFRLWHIHNIANILFNFSFAMTLWLAGKKQQAQ